MTVCRLGWHGVQAQGSPPDRSGRTGRGCWPETLVTLWPDWGWTYWSVAGVTERTEWGEVDMGREDMDREDRYRYQDMDTPLVQRDGEEAEQVSSRLELGL